MSAVTGIKHCQDVILQVMMDATIQSGIGSAPLIDGGPWNGVLFPKSGNAYWYYRHFTVTEDMIKYADKLAIDVCWIPMSDPASPPEQVYQVAYYGTRGIGESLGSDFSTAVQTSVNAGEGTNLIIKRTRFSLSDCFTGKEGKQFCISIGREPGNALDTYGGNIVVDGAFFMKKGVGE